MAVKRRHAHTLEKLAFFCGIFLLIGVGIYALTSWDLTYRWIGIVLVLSGLVIFTAFFNRVLDIGRK